MIEFCEHASSEIGSFGLASSQMLVGDVSSVHALADGGLAKTMVHAVVGGVYGGITTGDATSGAIGGAMGEMLPSLMGYESASPLEKAQIKGVTQLAASSAILLGGGDVTAMETAGHVAVNVIENNIDPHLLKALQDMEATGEVPQGTVLETIEQGQKAKLLALDVTSDVASIVTLGPEAAPAKRMMVSAMKSGIKKLMEKPAIEVKVTKIDGSKIVADVTIGLPEVSNALPKVVSTRPETRAPPVVDSAKSRIVSEPLLARKYLYEMESITNRAVDQKQVSLLKKVLQENEFVPISSAEGKVHRDAFDKARHKLRNEWEKNTGQSWPVYTEDMGKRKAGDKLDAHHIIPVQYNGPNEWWNIYPSTLKDHHTIHSKDSTFKEIFNSKKDGKIK